MSNENDILSIQGKVEIQDKQGNTLIDTNNTILKWGKYKLLQSLFQTRNESIDAIKYLELYSDSMQNKNIIQDYKQLSLVKRYQISRRQNIEILYYNQISDTWNKQGSPLNIFYFSESTYRKKFLQEQITTPLTNQKTYVEVFDMEQHDYDKIMVQFSVPITKQFEDPEFSFNTLILTYGGIDQNTQMINPLTNEVTDPQITNIDPDNMTSGQPFSMVQLPEDFLITDTIYLFWKFVFTFNQKYD